MAIHKEGFKIILYTFLFAATINITAYYMTEGDISTLKVTGLLTFLMLFIVAGFFRSPRREHYSNEDAILAPADGKIVVIEEVEEPEYLKTKCLQVSIFMSPTNVHINWFPVDGVIKYFKHHKGRFRAAYLPKSSTENERTTIVLEHKESILVLIRQVAGAMARRIVSYVEVGKEVKQGQQLGFIKFGSRVDLYLPLDTVIDVKLNQKVRGKQTIIGWLREPSLIDELFKS
ncbi:MAG: phosphatidylserine decarboxylase family protein [Chlorobi bacterium]|nr:phosphatidylserine decarboxylase family protein [Chlorobiota bacterium]